MAALFGDCISLTLPSLLATAVLLTISCYLWAFTKWHYWKLRGVPYLRPVLPLVGNMFDVLFFKSLPDIANRIYKETKGLPFVGIYAFHTPVLLVRDLDLAATILVKHFEFFEDRGFHFNKADPLGGNVLHQTGPDWKFSRSKLTPCFNITKVKSMLSVMKSKAEVLVEKLKRELDGSVETYETMLRYSTDIVTLCVYGVEADSLRKNREHFRDAGGNLLGLYFIYHVIVGCFFPWLHKLLGITVAKAKVTKFFQEVAHQVITYQKNIDYGDSNSVNKDIVHQLLHLKKDSALPLVDKQVQNIDEKFIAAQSFIMFLAGFETPGNVLAYTLYEIAKNSHIQDKLYQELNSVLAKYDGEVTFEGLQELKYLRLVLSEALRKYTPLTLLFRRCTRDYVIPGTTTCIEKGTLVLIPLRSIHEDPDYYPDPESFNPDRFSEEDSLERHVAAYMPFGIGPRICPAVLYAYIKMKTAVVYILRQFELFPDERMPSSLEPNPLSFLLTPKNGIPLIFKKRKSCS